MLSFSYNLRKDVVKVIWTKFKDCWNFRCMTQKSTLLSSKHIQKLECLNLLMIQE